MFESAELGHTITKQTYARQVPRLRDALLDTQYDHFQNGRFPVIVLIGGVDGAGKGKGETVNLLNEWMDPRHIRTVAFGEPSDEERERPVMWRYWRGVAAQGDNRNPVRPLVHATHPGPGLSRHKHSRLVQSVEEIARFERMLSDEGALVLKFWFHLSQAAQKKRLTSLEKNPRTRWRVTDTDWERFKIYDRFRNVSEFTLRQTSTASAPWIVIEGADANYRNLTVGRALLTAMRERLDKKPAKRAEDLIAPNPPAQDNRDVLSALDLQLKIDNREYAKLRELYQGKLNLLARNPRFKNRSLVLVFEGNDAAGKGGAIRRITQALDARDYQSVPIAAPPRRSVRSPTCGVSGAMFRATAGSRYSTGP